MGKRCRSFKQGLVVNNREDLCGECPEVRQVLERAYGQSLWMIDTLADEMRMIQEPHQ